MDEAYVVVLRRQPPRIQTGGAQAADGRYFQTQGAHFLIALFTNSRFLTMPRTLKFQINRNDPDRDAKPYMLDLTVQFQDSDMMLLDALQRIKVDVDESLGLRRSCREGVCGSD